MQCSKYMSSFHVLYIAFIYYTSQLKDADIIKSHSEPVCKATLAERSGDHFALRRIQPIV